MESGITNSLPHDGMAFKDGAPTLAFGLLVLLFHMAMAIFTCDPLSNAL